MLLKIRGTEYRIKNEYNESTGEYIEVSDGVMVRFEVSKLNHFSHNGYVIIPDAVYLPIAGDIPALEQIVRQEIISIYSEV